MLCALRSDLDHLDDRHRRRFLVPRAGIDFASNDYLGLAGSARLRGAVSRALERGVAIGAGGSRLLRGNDPEHVALEDEAAIFFGAEAALFFASGFAANVALFATLPQTGDLVVHDALIHASAHEGIRLGRATRAAFAHNDADACADAIARWRREGGIGTPWIAVESLYSMDGDRAPLAALIDIADRHDAMLLVDEAHATGVFGVDGRGLTAIWAGRPNLVTLHTCGKAVGVEGALVCGPDTVRDFLVNRAHGFVFSTAPSPLIASAVRAALTILRDEPERRVALHALVATAGAAFASCGATVTGSPILPIVLGDDARALAVAAAIQAGGFDVRAIRPPTVPAGTARLRLSITLNATAADVTALGETLERVLS